MLLRRVPDCATCDFNQQATKGVYAYSQNVAAPAVLAGEGRTQGQNDFVAQKVWATYSGWGGVTAYRTREEG